MKKTLIAFALIIVCGMFYSQAASAQAQAQAPAPFDPPVVKAFADSLYEEGFLLQAEGEYKRYLFSTDEVDQTAILSLTNIYKKQNDIAGITWLKEGFFDSAEPLVKEKINHVQAGFIFKERNAEAFSDFVQSQTFSGHQSLFSPQFVNLVNASDLLLKKDIPGLKALCSETAPQFSVFQPLADLSASYKTKKPALALLFSMVLPGSGKWYTGSFGAFFSSFMSVGSFVAGTVITGIQTSWKSWQPYVFGTCALVLYITDLYGSYQSAKRYNDALFRILCEETDKLYEVTY